MVLSSYKNKLLVGLVILLLVGTHAFAANSPHPSLAGIRAACTSWTKVAGTTPPIELIPDLVSVLEGIGKGTIRAHDPRVKELVLTLGGKLEDTGQLPTIVNRVLTTAFDRGLLPKEVTKEKLPEYAAKLAGVIDAELSARGATSASKGVQYEEWGHLADRIGAEIRTITEPILKDRKVSGFRNPEFIRAFEQQTGAKFHSGDEVKILVDGPTAFKARDEAFDSAEESIYILSWAFYDDTTGQIYSQKLIAAKKKNPKLDIRVLVDGQTARGSGFHARLDEMAANGIEVMKWFSQDPLRRYDGQHRKATVIDGEVSFEGGTNYGDDYSHLGPTNSHKWRDTDVRIKGPGAAETYQLIQRIWNSQRNGMPAANKSQITGIPDLALKPAIREGKKQPQTALVNHEPGLEPAGGGPDPLVRERIYRANLMAIDGAKDTIDIENAYIILEPGIYKALLRAKRRGVRIRILTNSLESVDVPEIGYVMMKSANRLAKAGFEVYLKKGDTLHTKMMNVDGVYSWVGSENIHPRSLRYEGEIIRNVLDEDFGKTVISTFENDISPANATKLDGPVPLPNNIMGELFSYWFFDQL